MSRLGVHRERAFTLLTSLAVKRAFDLGLEPDQRIGVFCPRTVPVVHHLLDLLLCRTDRTQCFLATALRGEQLLR